MTRTLQRSARPSYALIAVRTADVLNRLFPPDNDRFIRVRVVDEGTTVGWALVMSNQLADHNYFGSLRLGSIADCLSAPGKEALVVSAATACLQAHQADLIVTNQNHATWRRALRENGYLSGPSNFLLACSPALAALLAPLDEARPRIHVTRGDGDGPIHL